jgi:hypothetical protein
VTDASQAQPRGRVLARIAAACVDRLPIDDVTVLLSDGRQQSGPAYATTAGVASLEETAFTTGDGPSVDALRLGVPVLVPDLRTSARAAAWTGWLTAALDEQIRAVHAFPIQAGAITAGVLTMYARQPLALDDAQLRVALRLADEAFLGLLDVMSGVLETGDEDRGRLDGAVLRADVHRAAGMVTVQTGLRIDEALVRLRAHAYAVNRPISEIAADVIAGRRRFNPDRV